MFQLEAPSAAPPSHLAAGLQDTPPPALQPPVPLHTPWAAEMPLAQLTPILQNHAEALQGTVAASSQCTGGDRGPGGRSRRVSGGRVRLHLRTGRQPTGVSSGDVSWIFSSLPPACILFSASFTQQVLLDCPFQVPAALRRRGGPSQKYGRGRSCGDAASGWAVAGSGKRRARHSHCTFG